MQMLCAADWCGVSHLGELDRTEVHLGKTQNSCQNGVNHCVFYNVQLLRAQLCTYRLHYVHVSLPITWTLCVASIFKQCRNHLSHGQHTRKQ